MPYMKIFEREAKSILDSELYNNIFVKTELSDEEIYATSKQIWHSITANYDLIMNIFSLNTGVFLFYSIAKKLSIFTDVKLQELIALRKEENLKIILKSVLIS
jgi:hypothetical protein